LNVAQGGRQLQQRHSLGNLHRLLRISTHTASFTARFILAAAFQKKISVFFPS
jgi:hypothetical protein